MTKRDLDLEARSFTHHRCDRDPVPQQIDNASDNRQAKTHAVATRRSKLVELLEEVLHFRTRDAATRVVHFNHQAPVLTAAFDPYAAPLGAFDRITNQVVQRIAQQSRIGVNGLQRPGSSKTSCFPCAGDDQASAT